VKGDGVAMSATSKNKVKPAIGHMFSTAFPYPEAWSLFYQQSMAYLDRVAYFIGIY